MKTLPDDALQELLESKSVVIFSDLVLNQIFSAIEFEILARLSENGTPTTTIVCSGDLPWCFQNPSHSSFKCVACKSLRKSGQNIAAQKTARYLELKCAAEDKNKLRKLAEELIGLCEETSDIEKLTYKGISIGPGVGSTLSFSTKNPNPDLTKHFDLATRLLTSTMIVVDQLPMLLEQTEAQHLLVGSGRLATNWAASRIAEEMGIQAFSYENIPPNSFWVAPMSPFLHIKNMKNLVEYYDDDIEGDEGLIREAENFYMDQRFPKPIEEEIEALANQNLFLDRQVSERLPDNFDPLRRNIAIFTSSEWEFSFLPDWENSLGKSQGDIISGILLHQELDPDLVFWLRFHPNQRNVEKEVILNIKNSCGDLCKYIEPDAPVDSYALMLACEKIVSFGSTIGMEATYWGIPSILCGRAEYESTDAVYRASSIDHSVKLLNEKIEARSQGSAYAYALYRRKKGIEFKYAKLKFPKFPKVHEIGSANVFARSILLTIEKLQLVRKFQRRLFQKSN